jgi:hypothetical protein
MTAYVKQEINNKTVWLPQQQAAQPVPPKAPARPKAPYAKRIGKKYGERKTWW